MMITPITIKPYNSQIQRRITFKSNVIPSYSTVQNSQPFVHYNIPSVKVSPVTTVTDKSRNSYNLFVAKMETIFFDCTRGETRNPKNAIGTIEYKKDNYRKGLDSIQILRIRSGAEAKRFINDNDLISARIILDKGTKAEGNKVLAKLQKAIKEGKIVVKEISQYGVNETTDYADNSKVNAILEESNKLGISCQKLTNRKANGYHSVIVKMELDDGFTGTLEFMGKEVSKLKDVEDVLYSMNKKLPVEAKYAPLKKEYDKLTPEQHKGLRNYTKSAYISARSDEIFGRNTNGFLPLSDSNLPQCFDFNNIAKI